MPSLTDGEIRRALKQVEQTGKQLSLIDGEGHGTGRLVLVMKPMPTRVTADWMAQQWRDQKRLKKKLGSYPSMSLSKAREVFNRDFADMIQKGRSIKIAGDTRPGTVADLFEAYVAHLKASGKSSWKEAEKGFNKIADTLGRNRPARDIEPDEITDLIRPIYDRGKRSMADHVRSYIRSAYSWGLKSEHDYRSASQRRFRLVYNPAAGIPTEPKKVGTRWLDEEEFLRLYRWLECPDTPVHPPYTRAVRILMLTGQRVEEIARLHVDQWDAKERIIDWSKTKNGKPHAIPVPEVAAELIEFDQAQRARLVFPLRDRPDQTRQPWHALLVHVASARARGDPGRDQPRSAQDLENACWTGWPVEGNSRPAAKPHAPGCQLEELRSLELHAGETGRDEEVECFRPGDAEQEAPQGENREASADY